MRNITIQKISVAARILLCWGSLSVMPVDLFAQVQKFEISGIVVDKTTQEPIPGANVFLNNTSFKAVTGLNGQFSIRAEAGSYQIISYVPGYENISNEVQVGSQVLRFRFEMEVLHMELEARNVVSERDPVWYENLKLFETLFLGSSFNAKRCVIRNPKVLVLDRDTVSGELKAWAKDLLIIENKRLGYKIEYLLKTFNGNVNNGSLSYLGYANFEDLTPLKYRRRWSKLRNRSYYGSVNHWLKALVKRDLEEQGFEMWHYPIGEERLPVSYEEIFPFANQPNVIQGPKKIQVVYTKEKEEHLFQRVYSYPNRGHQVSVVEMQDDAVKVDIYGNPDPPLGIFYNGYMAWERIADTVPLNYIPINYTR